MDRRRFIEAGLSLGALAPAGRVRADQETRRRFHAALAQGGIQGGSAGG